MTCFLRVYFTFLCCSLYVVKGQAQANEVLASLEKGSVLDYFLTCRGKK